MEIKEIVIHTLQDSKYKIQFEQAATKGVLGFKCEVNDDDFEQCQIRATGLLKYVQNQAARFVTVPAPANGEVKTNGV